MTWTHLKTYGENEQIAVSTATSGEYTFKLTAESDKVYEQIVKVTVKCIWNAASLSNQVFTLTYNSGTDPDFKAALTKQASDLIFNQGSGTCTLIYTVSDRNKVINTQLAETVGNKIMVSTQTVQNLTLYLKATALTVTNFLEVLFTVNVICVLSITPKT